MLLLLANLLLAPAGADIPPPEDSVWSQIEANSGVQLSEEDRVAAQELADERFEEQRYLGTGALGAEADLGMYRDPLKTLEVDPLHLNKVAPGEFDIPVVVNSEVRKWMRYFLGSGRKWFHRYLERSTAYTPMMKRKLRAAGLPEDLIYVSMVESGFSNIARSYASAVGLWQFMTPTGRAYGLRIDYWADERVDPQSSTEAAIAYLADLKRIQGDWYLAWASYNAGPGRVNSAIRRSGSRNFWVLARNGTLPAETANYVPKVLAAAIIAKHPERYGFTDVEYQSELRYQAVEVAGAVTMDVIARCAGVTEQEIVALNPALLRGSTPPDGTTLVRIPEGTAEAFAVAFEKIPPSERISYRRHKVARGENLGGIAKRYGVSSQSITKLNRISDPNRIYVGMELVIPVPGADVSDFAAAAAPATTTVHTVRKGDTLAAIATRYGVTLDQLVQWNSLASAHHITVGQKLTIRGGNPSSTTSLRYTVRKGDNLSAIAARFGVTTSQVMEWNGISNPSLIKPGQVLKLYGPSQDWRVVEVRSGDSLGRIAQAQGCTVAELKSWNNLSGATIYPGQKLRVRTD